MIWTEKSRFLKYVQIYLNIAHSPWSETFNGLYVGLVLKIVHVIRFLIVWVSFTWFQVAMQYQHLNLPGISWINLVNTIPPMHDYKTLWGLFKSTAKTPLWSWANISMLLALFGFHGCCYWNHLSPPKAWSWNWILGYTSQSAHISRDSFMLWSLQDQIMLVSIHQFAASMIIKVVIKTNEVVNSPINL